MRCTAFFLTVSVGVLNLLFLCVCGGAACRRGRGPDLCYVLLLQGQVAVVKTKIFFQKVKSTGVGMKSE